MFKDIPKERVAALLATFPKLTSSKSQHTSVENDNVRYVYQPLEELYIVLITNRQSNILQDIETLRLLAQIVSSMLRNPDEREILANAFEILGAFDEVVSLGYRENLTLSQVRTFLDMDSHEEKIQEIIERNKELEAAEERKKKAKQLEMQRRELARKAPISDSGLSGLRGMGSGYVNAAPSASPSLNASMRSSPATVFDYQDSTSISNKPTPKGLPKGKGLVLERKKASSAIESLRGEAEQSSLLLKEEPPQQSRPASGLSSTPAVPAVSGIKVSVVETISALLGRDGIVKSAEIKGSLQLQVGDPNLTKLRIVLNSELSKEKLASTFKTHPNVDKAAFYSGVRIGLKDPNRSFPSNGQQLGVLRWKLTDEPAQYVPLGLSCWLSRSDPGFFDVTLEYEYKENKLNEPLKDVRVIIPLVSSNTHVNDPSTSWSQYDDYLEWTIPEIVPGTETASASFEFTTEADSENEIFPIRVQFAVPSPASTFASIEVVDVISALDESESLPYEKAVSLQTEEYVMS